MKKSFFLIFMLGILLSLGVLGQDSTTFLFYADSRAGVFSNWFQNIHEKFVKKVVEHEKQNNIQHLIFGGDNVWLGFMDSSWKRFFEITENFRKANMKIYPALGNHELILSRTLFNYLQRQFPEKVSKEPYLSDYQEFVKTLSKEYSSKHPTEIYKLIHKVYDEAQEESLETIQTIENPGILSTSWERFKKYVDAWPYLQEVIQQGKTYYSFTLPIGKSRYAVKIVVIDSNNTSDPEQQAWIQKEASYSQGPVVFICHHPIFYPEKQWNTPPHLWLTGHYHDYERRSITPEANSAPVHIISGSGGAPLEFGGPHCDDEKTYVHKPFYNYTKVTVSTQKIHVVVFGCASIDDPFQKIDEFEFSWKK